MQRRLLKSSIICMVKRPSKKHSVEVGLSKFRSEDFSLKEKPHSGRRSEVDDDDIKALLESDRHVTEREIAEILSIPKSIVHNHLRRLELVKNI
ncbi:unnamed protein product [Ceratitis capitata]|uniref:(Mediterranean fruit fly) hypothetical protein n=1 Tax=Ceratitis capitata TaxID=7213 RepID=A0A811VHG2_CERCA|nr:unnamed protein product [Ceratitis capitata]